MRVARSVSRSAHASFSLSSCALSRSRSLSAALATRCAAASSSCLCAYACVHSPSIQKLKKKHEPRIIVRSDSAKTGRDAQDVAEKRADKLRGDQPHACAHIYVSPQTFEHMCSSALELLPRSGLRMSTHILVFFSFLHVHTVLPFFYMETRTWISCRCLDITKHTCFLRKREMRRLHTEMLSHDRVLVRVYLHRGTLLCGEAPKSRCLSAKNKEIQMGYQKKSIEMSRNRCAARTHTAYLFQFLGYSRIPLLFSNQSLLQ